MDSIRNRLVAAFVFLGLVIGGLTTWDIGNSRRNNLEAARGVTEDLSRTLAYWLASTLDRIDQTLFSATEEVRRQELSGRPDAQEIGKFLDRLESRLPGVYGLFLVDKSGVLIHGKGVTDSPKVTISDRSYFAELRDHPDAGLVISDPVLGRLTGSPQLVAARRINCANGGFCGVVFAPIYLDQITEHFAKLNIGDTGVISLRNRQSALVCTFPKLENEFGRPGNIAMSAEIGNLLATGQTTGSYLATSPTDAVLRTYTYQAIEGTPFYLVVGLGIDEYLRDWTRETRYKIVLLIALFAVLAGAFWKLNGDYVENRKAELVLRENEERYKSMFADAKAVMLLTDAASGAIIEANSAALSFYGYDREQMRKMHISDISALSAEEMATEVRHAREEHRDYCQFPHRLASGKIREVEVYTGHFQQEGKEVLHAIIHDVTERKAAEERIGFLANHDRLTELPNRELFYDRISQAISRARRRSQRLAIFFLDLDDFKPINDKYGHEAGDLALIKVARRLRSCVREADTAARLGGDEFATIIDDIDSVEDAAIVASKIIASISQTMRLSERLECRLGVSIGIAIYPDNGLEIDKLMSEADAAMYESKSLGKNNYVFSRTQRTNVAVAEPWITLDESKRVGLSIIDEQHQRLADMLNGLNFAVKRTEPTEVTLRLLDELISYARFHFETEDRLMELDAYPDQAVHRQEHQKLIDETTFLRAKFIRAGELVVLQALKDWLLSHIVTHDKALGDFLVKQQARSPGSNARE